jgi:hypothetical protein
MSYVWLLLTPVTFLFNLIFSFIAPAEGAASASGQQPRQRKIGCRNESRSRRKETE